MNTEQDNNPEVTNDQQQIETTVEMIDLHFIQVQAIMDYATDMCRSLNNIINARNDVVNESDKAFMTKVVQRRDFYNQISDICYNSIKPYITQLDGGLIDEKNFDLASQTERLILSCVSDKYITDDQSFDVMDSARRQLMHSKIAGNKVRISPIKFPKAALSSLNLI